MTLKDYLSKKKLTYRAFSKKVDIDSAQLVRWANGQILPSLKNAYKIYKATRGQVKLHDWFKDEK